MGVKNSCYFPSIVVTYMGYHNEAGVVPSVFGRGRYKGPVPRKVSL